MMTPITVKLYSAKAASEILAITERSVRRYCNEGKIMAEKYNGNQYRITQAALAEFAEQNAIELNIPPDTGVLSNNMISSYSEQAEYRLPLCPPASDFSLAKEKISPKAKEIALARQDVLNLWQDYRMQSEKKTSADKDFVNAFNSKIFAPELFKKIGRVSTGTLHRWRKTLEEAGDYTALAPQYNYASSFEQKTELTQVEKKYFLDLMLQPNKINVGSAYRLIKFTLQRQGIKEIRSYSAYKRFWDWFQSKNNDICTLMRYGQKALVDNVAPYINRDAGLLNVGDVLVADGHVLDFQVKNPFNGKPCRAILIGYVDWKSTDLAGYEIMLTENTQCIASALRNSIINLGKIPKISYQDNGRAFRAKYFTNSPSFDECGFNGLFGKLGIIPVFARPYNARAKIAERFFREFSETFEKLLPSYVGNSPTNKPAYMMRNEKFHKSIHNDFVPTIEEAHQLINAWLEFHRSQPCPNVKGMTIGEVFAQGCGEGVDTEMLDELMMASESRKIGRNGVKFLGNHYFSNSLYGITDKVEIRYSLFDLSYVKVYTENGDYLGPATTVMDIHPMAEYLGDRKDVYSLKKALKEQKGLQKQTMQKAKQLLPHLDKPLEWQNSIETKQVPAIEAKEKPAKKKYELVYDESLDLQKKAEKKRITDMLPYDPNLKFKEKPKYELKYEQL